MDNSLNSLEDSDKKKQSTTCRLNKFIWNKTNHVTIEQDRRWNAEKPSATLDP